MTDAIANFNFQGITNNLFFIFNGNFNKSEFSYSRILMQEQTRIALETENVEILFIFDL